MLSVWAPLPSLAIWKVDLTLCFCLLSHIPMLLSSTLKLLLPIFFPLFKVIFDGRISVQKLSFCTSHYLANCFRGVQLIFYILLGYRLYALDKDLYPIKIFKITHFTSIISVVERNWGLQNQRLVWASENQDGDSMFEGVIFHKYNKEYYNIIYNKLYLIYNSKI